ncbi:hypothetical protein B296_00001710 [Ensete ventricosum]|uniref:Piwi domain-containing protein n=1 Tax=Ensete ventricosum TaxID=4639 RepID=A0A427B4W8_ENSVE|nr:hypothetical protein B296_00001710 [Ensete ventricosum]
MFQKFNCGPVIPAYSAKPEQVEKAIKHVYSAALNKLKGKELELLIAILPDNNGSLYCDLKRICETDLGLISQCCLTKHVFKISKQYLANVSLKINVKVVDSQDWPEVTKYAGLVCAQARRHGMILSRGWSKRRTILPSSITRSRCYSKDPPAYYAHLAAFRARFYVDRNISENSPAPSMGSVKPLPAVKEKVKQVMSYC